MSADFWAGYISGATGIIVGNPLDLVKTRLQAGAGSGLGPQQQQYAASAVSLRTTFDQAGTLVRGATAPVLGYGALNALLFVTYNRSLAFLSPDPAAGPNYGSIYIAGVLGGLATFVVSAPTELIKVRAQVASSSTSAASDSSSLTSSLAITKDIWKREGLRGMYLGGGVTAARDAIGYGFYFCSYDLSKRLLSHSPNTDPEALSAWRILLAGGVAGCISWASIFPLDVIKTRIQTQPLWYTPLSSPVASPPSSPSQRPLLGPKRPASVLSQAVSSFPNTSESVSTPIVPRQSVFVITANAYREGGVSVFFRGLGICSVRAFIVNAVQWAVYEWVMAVLVEGDRRK